MSKHASLHSQWQYRPSDCCVHMHRHYSGAHCAMHNMVSLLVIVHTQRKARVLHNSAFIIVNNMFQVQLLSEMQRMHNYGVCLSK